REGTRATARLLAKIRAPQQLQHRRGEPLRGWRSRGSHAVFPDHRSHVADITGCRGAPRCKVVAELVGPAALVERKIAQRHDNKIRGAKEDLDALKRLAF